MIERIITSDPYEVVNVWNNDEHFGQSKLADTNFLVQTAINQMQCSLC